MGGGVPGAQSRAAGAWTRGEVVMSVQHQRREGGLWGEPQRGWVACPEKEHSRNQNFLSSGGLL